MTSLAHKIDAAPQELPLEIIADALWMHAEHYSDAARAVLDGLAAAGYVISRAGAPAPAHKPVKAPAKRATPRRVVEIFAPNTGDSALDEFMRKHHNPKWKPRALPKPRKLSRLSGARYAAIESDWVRMCNTARGDIAAGRKSSAERLLREAAALHSIPAR